MRSFDFEKELTAAKSTFSGVGEAPKSFIIVKDGFHLTNRQFQIAEATFGRTQSRDNIWVSDSMFSPFGQIPLVHDDDQVKLTKRDSDRSSVKVPSSVTKPVQG